MKLFKLLLVFGLVTAWTLPGYCHDLWTMAGQENHAVLRGRIPDDLHAYDTDCVTQVLAFDRDGLPLTVEREDRKDRVVFQTDTPAALTSVVCKWGDRVNTTQGKKLMSRKEAEEADLTVISSFFSTQFSKTLFISSDQNLKPLGLKFEIVPKQCPFSVEPGNPVSFKVLFEGEPLENGAVYTSDDREFKTDKQGTVCISFEKNDVRMMYAKHKVPDNTDSGLDYLQFMTFLNIVEK